MGDLLAGASAEIGVTEKQQQHPNAPPLHPPQTLPQAQTVKVEPQKADKFKWPLDYKLSESSGSWFNYSHYRDAENNHPTVLYCTTREDSEKAAKKFLEEPIIGFDMEWQSIERLRKTIKDEISVIQLASETHIAIFHLAAHQGTTVDAILAPSLRKILENPKIAKAGVNVMGADFSRLKKHFGLKPQGAFELSRLYRLVMYGGKHLTKLKLKQYQIALKNLTHKLVAFDTQVQNILNLKLSKGPVRTSNWSSPSRLSFEQQRYAANDAYAGFILFHIMDAKRKMMDPVPPLPLLCTDSDDSVPVSNIHSLRYIQLYPRETGGEPLFVYDFWTAPKPKAANKLESENDASSEEDPGECDSTNDRKETKTETKTRKTKVKKDGALSRTLDTSQKELFDLLKGCRLIQAADHGFSGAFLVAHDSVLADLAYYQPISTESLRRIKGIGPKKVEMFGEQWVDVIVKFRTRKDITTCVELPPAKKILSADTATTQKSNVDIEIKAEPPTSVVPSAELSSSSPAFATPPRAPGSSNPQFSSPRRQPARSEVNPPLLHTGLSFGLQETTIDTDADQDLMDSDSLDEVDWSIALEKTFGPGFKRKRAESPSLSGSYR